MAREKIIRFRVTAAEAEAVTEAVRSGGFKTASEMLRAMVASVPATDQPERAQ